jgi:endonuclease YncB( thermonuclease family)
MNTEEGVVAKATLERRWKKGRRVQLAMKAVDSYGRVVADIIPDRTQAG